MSDLFIIVESQQNRGEVTMTINDIKWNTIKWTPYLSLKQILKIVDVFKLQASCFLYDFDNNLLPMSLHFFH